MSLCHVSEELGEVEKSTPRRNGLILSPHDLGVFFPQRHAVPFSGPAVEDFPQMARRPVLGIPAESSFSQAGCVAVLCKRCFILY